MMSSTMRWADANAMRRFNGLPFESDDPNFENDTVLEYYLDRAKYAVRPDVMTQIRDDQLSGSINGSNVEFYCTYYPIADENFDSSINASDVTCYGWGDLDDYYTKTSVGVASVNFKEGRILLSSAPSSTFESITADYHYSLYELNYTLMEAAQAYMAGFLYFNARYMEVPNNVRIGAQAYRMDEPSLKAWNAYLTIVSRIRTQLISHSKTHGMKLNSP